MIDRAHPLFGRYGPWLVYPVVIAICIVLHGALMQGTMSLPAATLLPVLLGAGLVTALERAMPYRPAWQGARSDVGQDLLYMAVVQMALPKLLGLLIAVTFVASAAGAVAASPLWPHHWPLAAQALLMLAGADFLRYWLHRLAHENPFLWRFHAVHHSPRKLYWLNVGRFHPVDKTLQFLLDAAPFILLGVGEAVISLYFVFYAVNGFFQHSNVRMRLGVLNYLISSAELHRWHHSRETAESNTNYGNNLIVWDILFGTRYLPKGRHVKRLGLQDPHYPMAFMAQLRSPFTRLLEENGGAPSKWRNRLANGIIKARMGYIGVRHWWPLRASTYAPARTQRRLLRRLVRRNRTTRYGAEHGFDRIHGYDMFCRRVPVNDYESLRAYIEAQASGEHAALISERPVMYAATSGTTGAPKRLPVTAEGLARYRRSQAIFSYLQYRHCPEAFRGQLLGIAGGRIEGRMENGLPYGSVSGMLYRHMPVATRLKYVIPPGVFELEDYGLKYYLILRLAVACPDISYIACANPSTLLRLVTLLEKRGPSLATEVERGVLEREAEVPAALNNTLRMCIRPDPSRAEALRRAMEDADRPLLSQVWPGLKMIATWTQGSCGIALDGLKPHLAPSVRVVDLGYLASELRGTFTLDHETGSGIPSLRDNFFEFVRKDQWDEGQKEFLTLDRLAPGEQYHVIVTTGDGLYRYFMNDIVQVTGWFNRTPLLRFVQKGRGVTNITGEKLYESQVIEAVQTTARAYGFSPRFFIMVAEPQRALYSLFIEADRLPAQDLVELAGRLDEALGALNVEYRAKRAGARLMPPEVVPLQPGTAEAYKQAGVNAGQKESQYKTVALQYHDQLSFDFRRYAGSSPCASETSR